MHQTLSSKPKLIVLRSFAAKRSRFALVALLGIASIATSLSNYAVAQERALPQKDGTTSVADPSHIQRSGLEPYAAEARKWEKEVTALHSKNATEGGDDAIVFLGSSSIRLWNSIEQDVAPWKPVRRGYGGAKYCDLAIYAPKLIQGLKFQGAVVFVANDITGSDQDKSAKEISRLSKIVIDSIREENSQAPILLLSITATPSRFKHWPKIQEANRSLGELARHEKGVFFLETQESYLTQDGQPRPEFFVKDMLHQNPTGYKVWGELVTKKLNEMPGLKPSESGK